MTNALSFVCSLSFVYSVGTYLCIPSLSPFYKTQKNTTVSMATTMICSYTLKSKEKNWVQERFTGRLVSKIVRLYYPSPPRRNPAFRPMSIRLIIGPFTSQLTRRLHRVSLALTTLFVCEPCWLLSPIWWICHVPETVTDVLAAWFGKCLECSHQRSRQEPKNTREKSLLSAANGLDHRWAECTLAGVEGHGMERSLDMH